MNFQSIEDYITQFPIYQYAFLSIDDIEFNDKVRTICKRECPRYGKSWSCPPAVGTVDKCKERCQQYTHALLFSSVAEVPDYSNMDHRKNRSIFKAGCLEMLYTVHRFLFHLR